jgi:TRAP-type C4-dicarboxylate transport system substrate-binding protein
MNFGEVYTALQSGTIEGQDNPLPTIVASACRRCRKFVSLTQHGGRAPEFIDVNARWWTGSTPRVRELLGVRRGQEDRRAGHRRAGSRPTWRPSAEANAAINEVDQAAFRARARPVLDRIGHAVPGRRHLRRHRARGAPRRAWCLPG